MRIHAMFNTGNIISQEETPDFCKLHICPVTWFRLKQEQLHDTEKYPPKTQWF